MHARQIVPGLLTIPPVVGTGKLSLDIVPRTISNPPTVMRWAMNGFADPVTFSVFTFATLAFTWATFIAPLVIPLGVTVDPILSTLL